MFRWKDSTKRNFVGRKSTLIWVGVLYLVSALGSGLATDPYMFSFFRFLGGVGVGASTVAAPTYISEISTAKSRGRLVALYQFNIVFGILIAFISNYLLDGVGGSNDWRWMLGVEAYCDLRMANGTQKEHMDVAKKCWDIITGHFPSIAEALSD